MDEIYSILYSRCSFLQLSIHVWIFSKFSLLEIAQEGKSTFHLKYKEFLRKQEGSVEELIEKTF